MKITDLSDEQLRTLADTFGIESDAEGDELRRAVADKMVDLTKDEVETPTPVPTPGLVTLSEADYAGLKAGALLATALAEERRTEKRDAVINGGVEQGKLAPADVDTWRSLYDADPEAATKAISEMPVNDDLVRAFGAEGGEGEADESTQREEAEYRHLAELLGIDANDGGEA